jgi:hypothetical protein
MEANGFVLPTKEEVIMVLRKARESKRKWQEDVNRRLDAKEEEIRKYKESHNYIYENI